MTPDEYAAALARIDELMDAKPGTPEMDELKRLTLLVEAYEDEHYPMSKPTIADCFIDAYWRLWRWSRDVVLGYVTRRWERRLSLSTGAKIEIWHGATRWLWGWSAWMPDGPEEHIEYWVGHGKTPHAAVIDLRRQLSDAIDREWDTESKRRYFGRIAKKLEDI